MCGRQSSWQRERPIFCTRCLGTCADRRPRRTSLLTGRRTSEIVSEAESGDCSALADFVARTPGPSVGADAALVRAGIKTWPRREALAVAGTFAGTYARS